MTTCARCGHNNEDVMMICTRCGASLHADRPVRPAGSFYSRVALGLILGVLLMVLLFLVLIYLQTANKLHP